MRLARTTSIVMAVSMAMLLVLGSAVAGHAGPDKKQFTLDVAPSAVTAGDTLDFVATITNKSTSQQLGSCNLTVPSAFTINSVTGPTPGTKSVEGNVIKLRDLSTAPGDNRSLTINATIPPATTPGDYNWVIECRQANNYSPDKISNRFNFDDPNSANTTTVIAPPPPPPQADLGVSQTHTPASVQGGNTVEFVVTVHNYGPAVANDITLSDSLPQGGSITSIDAGAGWSCPGPFPATSTSCSNAGPLTSGADASPVTVRVLTPNANTTVRNTASVSEVGAVDPNAANDSVNEDVTVSQDLACGEGFVSCGRGQIVYCLDSQVVAGTVPSATAFLVGTTTFKGVATCQGSQPWGMAALAQPGNFCPTDLTDTFVTECTFQMNLDPIPAPYGVGDTTAVLKCHSSRCADTPLGFLILVKIDDDGQHHILPQCSGPNDTSLCYTATFDGNGNLVVTVRNMTPGDPKVGGICIGGGC